MKRKKGKSMALNKKVEKVTAVTVSDERVMKSVSKMATKYRKTLDKLAKN